MAIKRRDTSDGPRYDVQWRLPDRSKRKKTFTTERAARQFAAKLVTSGAAGEVVDPRGGRIELRAVYHSWLASRPDLSPKVRRGYEDNWRACGSSRASRSGRSERLTTSQFSCGSMRCPRVDSVRGRFAGHTRCSR
jgi:hypothetical protein